MTPMNLSLDIYFPGISKLNNFSSVPIKKGIYSDQIRTQNELLRPRARVLISMDIVYRTDEKYCSLSKLNSNHLDIDVIKCDTKSYVNINDKASKSIFILQ